MAYYKTKLFGQNIIVPQDLNNVKAATAQLICIPFNTPYFFIVPGTEPTNPVQYDGPSTAANVASTWGFTFYRGPDAAKLKTKYGPPGSIINDAPSSKNEETNFGKFALAGQNSVDKIREVFSFFIDKRAGSESYHSYTTIDLGGIADWSYIVNSVNSLGPDPAAAMDYDNYAGVFPKDLNIPEAGTDLLKQFYSLEVDPLDASIVNETIAFEGKLLEQRYPNGDMPEMSFIDATFMLHKPFAEAAYKEALGEEIGVSDPVRVKANYNFYLQQYENTIKNLKVPTQNAADSPEHEYLLPNLYAIMIDAGGSNDVDYRFKYADQWQYHNDNLWQYSKAIFSRKSASQLDPSTAWPQSSWGKVTTFNEYLNNFAKKLDATANTNKTGDTSLSKSRYGIKYRTMAMSAYQMKDLMSEADAIKKFFPMHVDIEIPPSANGPIGKALYESNMFDQFMGVLLGALYPRTADSDGNKLVHVSTAIAKKDSYVTETAGGTIIHALEDNLYHEGLRKLWLNDILKTPSLPDLKNVGAKPVYSYGWPPQFYKTPPPTNVLTEAYTDISELWDALTSTQVTNTEVIQGLSNKLNIQVGDSPFTRPVILGQKEGPPVKFINNIKWAITTNKINEFIKEKTRSVREVYEGKLAHSEVLFYEVAKFRSEPPEAGGKYLQSIFLPNTPGMEVLKYIDTQVKFDNEYYYQIYAHTLVVGTQYEYTNLNSDWAQSESGVAWGNAKYKFTPSIYLIRTPYYNTYVTMKDAASIPDFVPQLLQELQEGQEGKTLSFLNHANQKPENLERTPIVDKPPVFPDVNFLPLYAEKDKILLNTNFNVGEYDLKPIFIDPVEDDVLDKIRRNQKRTGKNDKITFRGDDFCGKIQILRTDKKPLSWDSFAPTSNYIIGETGGNAALGFFDDTLQPNKDYYYTVRAKDVHGNFSNPSPIYHVRIVAKEGEAPYSIIKMFFLEEVEDKKPTVRKNLMKYIRIQPSFRQTFLDEKSVTTHTDWKSVNQFVAAGSGEIQKVIGDETLDKTVFGRNFKIRFTSKKTGRKFDLNLSIANPYVAPAEGLASMGSPDEYSSGKCD